MSRILKVGYVARNNSLIFSNQRLLSPFTIKTSIITTQNAKNASTDSSLPPPNPKPSRAGLKVILFTLAGFGIGFGYSQFDKDFKKKIESVVPYAEEGFKTIESVYDSYVKPIFTSESKPVVNEIPKQEKKQLVPIIEPVVKQQTPPVEQKPVITKPVVAEKPAATPTVAAPKVVPPPSKPTPAPSKASTQVQTEAPKATQSTAEQAVLESVKVEPKVNNDWKATLKEHELQEEAAIKAIESKLANGINDVVSRVNDALKSSQRSIETLNKYSESLKLALDDQNDDLKEKQWQQVTELFDKQSLNVQESNEKINAAKKAIFDLDRLLVDVKSSGSSKYIKNVKDVQQELIKQFRQLQSDKSKLSEAVIHANVLRSYTNEQRLARDQFLKEIQSLQPEGIRGKLSDDQLSSEELNSLLIHAHKRVLQLQKQINKMQLLENQHIQAALEEQRKQFDNVDKDNVLAALDVQKREFELEKDKIIEDVKLRLDVDLKKELSRQAAAHNNHLAKMLKQQQEELDALYEKRLIVESENIRKQFYDTVTASYGRLKGIEHALQARANLELQAQNAKQLWLAVQNLNEIITTKSIDLKENLRSKEYKELVDILTNVNIIKNSAPDNKFINDILISINKSSLERGVWSEPDLKERFNQVKTVCRQVALIDERGGSLFRYLLSYLQSKFVIKTRINADTTNKDLVLEQSNLLDTYKVLDYAQHYIDNGDFEMAIKLLTQLNGEPKRIAKNWIDEAILLVEVKQAINLITAYISSVYIGTNLKN